MVTNKVLDVAQTAQPAHGASFHRQPMNPRDYGRSGAVASWLSPTGEQRSLPTNIKAIPSRINVNSMRSRRTPKFADPLAEGGASYSAAVCIDNFAEERRDPSYVAGTVPTLVRCKGMYQTEYIQRYNDALPAYRQQLVDAGRLAAKVPVAGQDHRNSRRPGYTADYIQYARSGFARGLNADNADATIEEKQGSAWVGTAPCHMMRSVQRTTQAGAKPEFQKIHPSADGKMKCVMTSTRDGQPRASANLDTTKTVFEQGERKHARHWQTMYQTAICGEPRR